MQGLISNIAPDGKYELYSVTSNESQVAFSAKFITKNSMNGGHVKPHDTPRKNECDYTYIVDFDKDGKIKAMAKVWD